MSNVWEVPQDSLSNGLWISAKEQVDVVQEQAKSKPFGFPAHFTPLQPTKRAKCHVGSELTCERGGGGSQDLRPLISTESCFDCSLL